jgi:hypothetical protein
MFLIAHEVAHTLQQRGGGARPMRKAIDGGEHDAAEAAADEAAAAVLRGETGVAARLTGNAPMIQRKKKPPEGDPSLGALQGLLTVYRTAVDARLPDLASSTGRHVVSFVKTHPVEEELIDKLTVSMGPQILHGKPISGEAPTFPPGDSLSILPHEIEAVVGMLYSAAYVGFLLDHGKSELAMNELGRWRKRPVDFHFLKAILEEAGHWQRLHEAKNVAGETAGGVAHDVDRHEDRDGAFAESPVTGRYTIHMRSFAPFHSFGGGYHGDDRGFSSSLGVTSRIKETFHLDLDLGTVASKGPTSDKSGVTGWGVFPRVMATLTGRWGALGSMKDTAKDDGKHRLKREGDDVKLDAAFEGSMPLAHATPDIDLHGKFTLGLHRPGELEFRSDLRGDGFPNAEVLLVDAAGNVLLHHGFATSHGSFMGPTVFLWGKNNAPMGHGYHRLMLDPRGNFRGVVEGGGVVSVADVNARLEGKGKP